MHIYLVQIFRWSVQLKFTPHSPIEHRFMENHYTESLGHPDIKFYPLPTNICADEFPSDRKYYLFGLS